MKNLKALSCIISPRAGGQNIIKAASIPLSFTAPQTVQHKMLWDTTPRVSILCLQDIIAHDQIFQTFPLVFAYCKRSNTGGGNGLGMRLASCGTQAFSSNLLCGSCTSLVPRLKLACILYSSSAIIVDHTCEQHKIPWP